jgi:hypothetical protein
VVHSTGRKLDARPSVEIVIQLDALSGAQIAQTVRNRPQRLREGRIARECSTKVADVVLHVVWFCPKG